MPENVKFSRNQKRRALRSSENPTDRVGSRTLNSAYDSVAYNQVKTSLSESQAEAVQNKPMAMFDSGPCDWLVLSLLLPTPTI